MRSAESREAAMNGGRIAIVVDNPRRDLSGVVLLGRELVLRGYEVFLVPMNLRLRELPALAPEHIVVNYLRTTNDSFVGKLMDAGIAVSVSDTEGAVFHRIEALVAKMSRRSDVTSRLWRYCAWGQTMASFLVEHNFYSDSQVRVTGAPRMDFYSSPWRKAAEATSPARHMADGPLALVCGSFPFANPRFRTPEEQFRLRVEATGLDPVLVQGEFDKDQAGLAAFIDLTRDVAQARPDVTFVYRPHPFERIETYQEAFGALPNVHINGDGLVEGWILRASVTIQPADCTTGVEAAIAGVPSLIAGWVPGECVEAVQAVSDSCSDLDELLRRLDDGLASGYGRGTRRVNELVHSLFGPLDGRAHERVADEVVAGCGRGGRIDELQLRRMHYLPVPDHRLGGRLLDQARMRLRIPAVWSVRVRRQREPLKWDVGAKQFDAELVNGLLSALDEAAPDDRGSVEASAAESTHYRFGFDVGRSVRLANVHWTVIRSLESARDQATV